MLARFLSALVCAGLLVQTWLAYTSTGIVPGYAGSFYWFTIPHLLLLPLTIVTVVCDATRHSQRTFYAALGCMMCLEVTMIFAMSQWPYEANGSLRVWQMLFMAALLNLALGVPLICVARIICLLRATK